MAKCRCADCTWEGDEDDVGRTLFQVDSLAERLDPGSEVPVGECPECDCFAYYTKPEPTDEERAAWVEAVKSGNTEDGLLDFVAESRVVMGKVA